MHQPDISKPSQKTAPLFSGYNTVHSFKRRSNTGVSYRDVTRKRRFLEERNPIYQGVFAVIVALNAIVNSLYIPRI